MVDERSEIAACYLGVAQNDIGNSSDVLDNCPKSLGMRMLLRSMSPDVIAVDELGGESDIEALNQLVSLYSTVCGIGADKRLQQKKKGRYSDAV